MISASAAMEQMSSGQIGQPAACIIENNMALSCGRFGPSCICRADYGVTLAMLFARHRDFVPHAVRRPISGSFVIHCGRGQLCGQPGSATAPRQHRCDTDQIAEELSSKKMLYINSLLRHSIPREGNLTRRPSNGAAVELSGRTSLAFADA
jgi:hypothetical protein